MTTVDLNQHLRRQFVVSKLTEFFRDVDPRKLWTVDSLYQQYAENPEALLDMLLEKYPRAPRDTFDELRVSLDSLSATSETEYEQAATSKTAQQARVFELLRRGNELLETPIPKAVRSASQPMDEDGSRFAEDDDRSRYSSYHRSTSFASASQAAGDDDESGEEYVEDMRTLRQLIADNRALSHQVAIAEQQVMQKRFEILFQKVVLPSVASRSNAATASSAPLTLIIEDNSRVFQVTCSEAEMKYVTDGALSAPWSFDESQHCLVSFRRYKTNRSRGLGGFVSGQDTEPGSEFAEEPRQCIRSVMSMAMRVWSRFIPHTVTEALPTGDAVTHPSTVLWWQWPTTCHLQRGVTPRALVSHTASEFDVGLPVKKELATSERPSDVSGLHSEVANLLLSTPSKWIRHDASDQAGGADQNSETYWVHFMQQYRELTARAAPQ